MVFPLLPGTDCPIDGTAWSTAWGFGPLVYGTVFLVLFEWSEKNGGGCCLSDSLSAVVQWEHRCVQPRFVQIGQKEKFGGKLVRSIDFFWLCWVSLWMAPHWCHLKCVSSHLVVKKALLWLYHRLSKLDLFFKCPLLIHPGPVKEDLCSLYAVWSWAWILLHQHSFLILIQTARFIFSGFDEVVTVTFFWVVTV